MSHVLDNPVWNATISGNRHLVLGNEQFKYFDQQVSPFVAMISNTTANLRKLQQTYCPDRPILLWADQKFPIPDCWKQLDCIEGLQMVFEGDRPAIPEAAGLRKLDQHDIPAMLALAKLTRPGPFGIGTIQFGNYEGIFVNETLAAMTGRRFHCFDHIEVSAVCTHPEHTGRGYARTLLLSQVSQLLQEGATPYLHVRADNLRAIELYKQVGFTTRKTVFFYVLLAATAASRNFQ